MKQTFDPRLEKQICSLASQTGTIQTTKGRQDQQPVNFGLFAPKEQPTLFGDEIETLVSVQPSEQPAKK